MSANRPASFQLLRRFGGLAALAILTIAVLNAWMMAHFLESQLFQREAEVTQDFVQNVLQADDSIDHFSHQADGSMRLRFDASMRHLGHLRDVLRANVYGADRRVLWSSNPSLVGHRFEDNEELEEALRGRLVVQAGRLDAEAEAAKREHVGLSAHVQFFVETYIPVRDARHAIVGVVELYKAPVALTSAVHQGRLWASVAAGGSALLLATFLGGLILRTDRVLRAQQAQLLEAETLVAIGELSASVAHNIRNPLASIRSSAELAISAPDEPMGELARDILQDADRISARIDALLRLGRTTPKPSVRLDLAVLLSECARQHQARFQRRSQTLRLLLRSECADSYAWADPDLLEEVLDSLLSNASEAMAHGGVCTLALEPSTDGRALCIHVIDDGIGIAPSALDQVQRPFVSSKPQGMGLGLALARRAMERQNGRLDLQSRLGHGCTVTLHLPRATDVPDSHH